MKHYLRSRLGTRIAALFVLCALVPIVLLSSVSFVQVIGQLKTQARNRLRDESRVIAQAIAERLRSADYTLTMLAQAVAEGHSIAPLLVDRSGSDSPNRLLPFASVMLANGQDAQCLYGESVPLPALSPDQEQHLDQGKSVVVVTAEYLHGRQLQMVRKIPTAGDAPRLISAQISSDFMWVALAAFKPDEISQLCVLDGDNRIVYTYAPISAAFLKGIGEKIRSATVDLFDWNEHGRTHFVSCRSVFFGHQFGLPRLTVVTARPADQVLAPVASFRRGFPILVMLCIWVVLFLTLYEVRQRLVPLRELIEGTRQIAAQNFDYRVADTTGDEFAELGEAFNAMSRKIGRQLQTLNLIGEIDRGLLASVELEEIVGRALDGLRRVFSNCGITLATLDGSGRTKSRVYVIEPGGTIPQCAVMEDLSERERTRLLARPEGVEIAAREALPPYLRCIRHADHRTFIVMPILVQEHLEGVLSVGFGDATMPREEAEFLHQIAVQVALAMANANLVRALQYQYWGIVRAFARAVDAKSPWTHGHSERVTKLCLLIAKEMGYSHRQLEELERGALLHDVGKIGISSTILDKPAALTDEERLIIREHPRLGRRIIEPVGLAVDILNVISQHHERYDGQGYPSGLSGSGISLSARIAAVADVTDAMAADRPYRRGMAFDDVVNLVARDSGKAFDPQVVEVFLRIVKNVGGMDALMEACALSGLEAPAPEARKKVGLLA